MYKTKNKRNKRHKKTRKYYGGSPAVAAVNTNSGATFKQNEGVFNILGDKISGFASSAFNFIEEKALRVAGLKKIHDDKTDTSGNNVVEDGVNKASGIVSNAINNVNNVLKSPQAQETISAAAQDLAETGTKILDNFNQVASSPAFKQAVEVAADNVSDYAKITVEAMDEPLNEAADKLNEAGTKAASGLVSGAVKVGTDAMAAVPFYGAFFEAGKIVNDGSKALGDMVEAGTQVIETVSQVVDKTSKNIDTKLDDLEAKKQRIENLTGQKLNIPNMSNPLTNASAATKNASTAMKNASNSMTNNIANASNSVTNKMTNLTQTTLQTGGLKKLTNEKEQIGGRINDSLSEFSDPISYHENMSILKGGHNKTKKSFVKSNGKSKRVRFSI
jgi:hypothetical protein